MTKISPSQYISYPLSPLPYSLWNHHPSSPPTSFTPSLSNRSLSLSNPKRVKVSTSTTTISLRHHPSAWLKPSLFKTLTVENLNPHHNVVTNDCGGNNGVGVFINDLQRKQHDLADVVARIRALAYVIRYIEDRSGCYYKASKWTENGFLLFKVSGFCLRCLRRF